MSIRLALFDLDNTLLGGDSDHAWGEFLIAKGLVDAQAHRDQNDRFYADYQAGKLDIHAYVRFTLQPIVALTSTERAALHSEFMGSAIEPMILPAATALVEQHRQQGDYCVIITATNRFITEPIAERFTVDTLLATDLVELNERLTGDIEGTPCYQAGKITKLNDWLNRQSLALSLDNSVFYSDSFNDLPLLKEVNEAIAVDPDPRLAQEASTRGWRSMSLRQKD